MMNEFTICVIPGDGIGQEVIPAALAVLRATGLPLRFAHAEAGWTTFERTGTALPDATLHAARTADAILFGAVASPSHPVPGYRSPIVALRRELGLYANVRPTRTADRRPPTTDHRPPIADRPDRRPPTAQTAGADLMTTQLNTDSAVRRLPSAVAQGADVDLVVVRENTEGLYAGRERIEDDGNTAIAERVITRTASERIVRAACALARERKQLLTIVHKANVLRQTCGLFRAVALEVAAEYPEITVDELLVDNCALQLVLRPERFDVIVTTNLFGDILSDVACAWGGGLGLATSASYGEHNALFEPVHGAAPDIAGRGIANPLAAIGCAGMLLVYLAGRATARGTAEPQTHRTDLPQSTAAYEHDSLALQSFSDHIAAAVAHVTAYGPHTPDLGGNATTTDVTRAVIERLC